jgi:hypothetical protein
MLIYVGDSLLDTGNLLEVTSVGKRFAEALGIPVSDFSVSSAPEEEIDLYFTELFSGVFPGVNLDNSDYTDELVNFSVSAATTGSFGSSRVTLPNGTSLSALPVGLLSQADYLLASFQFNPGFQNSYKGSDLFLSGGGNDIFGFLDRDATDAQLLNPEILSALLSPNAVDDKQLIDSITGTVVGNIKSVVDKVSAWVDDIAILGPPKVAETPFLLGVAEALNSQSRGLGDQYTKFVNKVSTSINKQLRKDFKGGYKGKDILVIDGEKLFDTVITQKYTKFSSIASYQQAYFQDLVHPNDASSILGAAYLADLTTSYFGEFG